MTQIVNKLVLKNLLKENGEILSGIFNTFLLRIAKIVYLDFKFYFKLCVIFFLLFFIVFNDNQVSAYTISL